MKPGLPAAEPTETVHISNTQQQAKHQNWSQGLGLGFLYCFCVWHCLYTQNSHTNPSHLVICQDIPDGLLTLLFLLKVLMHLLSPVMCSALGNSQCSLNFSGKGNDLGFKQENSSEPRRLFCIYAVLKAFQTFCILTFLLNRLQEGCNSTFSPHCITHPNFMCWHMESQRIPIISSQRQQQVSSFQVFTETSGYLLCFLLIPEGTRNPNTPAAHNCTNVALEDWYLFQPL